MLKQDLVEILERASTVEEHLGGDFTPAGGNEAVVDERLEAWCQALGKGDWDRLKRRLAWDGLDPETVRPALGNVRLRDGAPLPEWSEILAEALRLAPPERHEDEAWPAQMGFLNAEDPLPFEEVLAPFALVARERLAGRTVASVTLLSAAARAALERSLLRNLSSVSGELLLSEFETMRGREQSSWDRLFALAQEPEGRSLYRQFVRRLGEGGDGPAVEAISGVGATTGHDLTALGRGERRVPRASRGRHARARAPVQRRRGVWQRRRARSVVIGSTRRRAQRYRADVRLGPEGSLQAEGHRHGGSLPPAASMAQRTGRAATVQGPESARLLHVWLGGVRGA